MEEIQRRIFSEVYRPGQKLPSTRILAADASVNPNTMQKALSELEKQGLLYSPKTRSPRGRYVTEDISVIKQSQNKLFIEKVTGFLAEMNGLGYGDEDILMLLTHRK